MIKYDEGLERIETERLILELPSESSVPSQVENINDLEILQWLLSVSYPHTTEDALNYARRSRKRQKEERPRTEYDYWMKLKGEEISIGGAALHKVNLYQGTGTVGYFVGKNFWRKGYVSEALGAIIDIAFDKIGLRRIEAQVFEGNLASMKLLKKFGFRQEGFQREAVKCRADSKIKDAYLYGLLGSEYENPMERTPKLA